jgi:hypothetical protein
VIRIGRYGKWALTRETSSPLANGALSYLEDEATTAQDIRTPPCDIIEVVPKKDAAVWGNRDELAPMVVFKRLAILLIQFV